MYNEYNIKISYSTHVSNLVPDRNYEIQTYSDLTITTGLVDKPAFVYQGNAYLVMSSLPPHQHFVRDLLAHYFIVSESLPDITMVMLDEQDKTYKEAVRPSYKEILETDCGLTTESYIKLSDYSSVNFKSVSFITNDSVSILEKYLEKYSINSPALLSSSTSLLLDSYNQLNSKLFKYKSLQLSTKKIFVSRKKEDKAVESILDSFYEYLKFGLQGVTAHKKMMEDIDKIITNSFPDQEGLNRGRRTSTLDHEFKYAAERLLAESEHEKLETFFSSLGYEILDAAEYTLPDQIAVFSEATHVAGIAGGGLINLIFCPPNTKVNVLSPSNTFYSGGYDHLFSRVFHDFYVSPSEQRNYQILEPNRKYSPLEIIEAFSKILPIQDL